MIASMLEGTLDQRMFKTMCSDARVCSRKLGEAGYDIPARLKAFFERVDNAPEELKKIHFKKHVQFAEAAIAHAAEIKESIDEMMRRADSPHVDDAQFRGLVASCTKKISEDYVHYHAMNMQATMYPKSVETMTEYCLMHLGTIRACLSEIQIFKNPAKTAKKESGQIYEYLQNIQHMARRYQEVVEAGLLPRYEDEMVRNAYGGEGAPLPFYYTRQDDRGTFCNAGRGTKKPYCAGGCNTI